MRVSITNVVSVKVRPIRRTREDRTAPPYAREIIIQVGSGDELKLDLSAWQDSSLETEIVR